MDLVELYNLKKDTKHIEDVQYATLHKPKYGLKIENGLLFGTDDWFKAIDNGIIDLKVLRGTISKVKPVGQHNESKDIEITSDLDNIKSIWGAKGKYSRYKEGNRIEIMYVIQKLKQPNDYIGEFIKVVLSIRIEE